MFNIECIQIIFFSCSSLEVFYQDYILEMGICAEGAHVDLGLLPRALYCSSNIVILPRENSSIVSFRQSTYIPCGDNIDGVRELGDIHLLFRPGHYDLLYQGADLESESALASVSVGSVNLRGAPIHHSPELDRAQVHRQLQLLVTGRFGVQMPALLADCAQQL